MIKEEKGVGAPLSRVEGRLKVTGGAHYAAEAPVPNAAFGYILQSTIAKGTITSMDTVAAQAAPGVITILTPDNMPKLHGGFSGDKRQPLLDTAVNYAGQHIAVVVADTPERARDAASLIKVVYAEAKPILDIHDARVQESHPDGTSVQIGDVDAALKADGLTQVQQTYRTPIETHSPMEMSATVALWEGDDRLTVWDATQGVSSTHDAFVRAFGLQPENVRVYCPYTGGGFGCKGMQWPHKFLAAAAAKLAKRPVRLVLSRQQMFTSCGHRPVTEQEMTLAAGKDGKLVALRHASTIQTSPMGSHIESCGMGTSLVMYASPNIDVTHGLRAVDLAPPTWMRAPGETPGSFALESAMDELAIALKMDPVEFRLVNHADVNPREGLPWSSKHLKECYATGAEKFGWSKRNPEPRSMRTSDGRRIGWGMASASYGAYKFPGMSRIRLMPDGKGGVRAVGAAASQDLGTGTWTIGNQMVSTLTGLPLDRVRFELGDSDLPKSGVSGGSTTAASIAHALAQAADALKAALLESATETPLANLKYSDVELKDGFLVSTADPSKKVDLAALLSASGKPYVEGATSEAAHLAVVGEDYAGNARKYAFHSFGAHFIEVVIDDPVPLIRVTRVVSAMDIGTVLNPKTATSQVIGGVVMGIGGALMEETQYDPRTGRPVSDNFADYAVPVNPDIPKMEVYFTDIPDVHFNKIGCRGVGEIGITGVAAAIANAVHHATGIRLRDLPFTPDKLL